MVNAKEEKLRHQADLAAQQAQFESLQQQRAEMGEVLASKTSSLASTQKERDELREALDKKTYAYGLPEWMEKKNSKLVLHA